MSTSSGLRGLALVAATATTAAVTLLGTALPAQAVPTYEVRVGSLETGARPEVPVVDGDRILDGDVTVPLTGFHSVALMGTAGDSYLLAGYTTEDFRQGVFRVEADGSTTRLVRHHDAAQLSDDGTRLATVRGDRRRSVVRVLDTGTGEVVARRVTRPWTGVLDVDATRVVIRSESSWATRVWRYRQDRVRTLRRDLGQLADLSSGVFSYYTGDPYDGGCTEMARIGTPRRPIWRSCRERLWAISPGGTRMATIHILADGPGPGEITLRRTAGRRIAELTAGGYFGAVTFEDDRDLLFEAVGPRREAWVRGNGRGVERVTRLRPARDL